jgi:hypothetical protein
MIWKIFAESVVTAALSLLVASATLSAMAIPANAGAKIVTFDVPGASETYVEVVNGNGYVGGHWEDADQNYHGYVRAPDGTISTFDPPNSQFTFVASITAGELIAGWYFDSDDDEHGFFRTADGTITTYDAPGSTIVTQINSVNNKGTFTGFSYDYPAFVQNAKGKFRTFDISGSDAMVPTSISEDGTIAGYYYVGSNVVHGFVRAPDGTITTFDPPGLTQRSTQTFAYAINSKNAIVGKYSDSNGKIHGFIRAADGAIARIDDPDGTEGTSANDINDEGTVVGWYIDGSGESHGYVRSTNGQFKSFDPPHATEDYAISINNGGQIAGHYADEKNVFHGYLRTPK